MNEIENYKTLTVSGQFIGNIIYEFDPFIPPIDNNLSTINANFSGLVTYINNYFYNDPNGVIRKINTKIISTLTYTNITYTNIPSVDDPPLVGTVQNKINEIVLAFNTKFKSMLNDLSFYIPYSLTYTDIPNITLVNNNTITIYDSISSFCDAIEAKHTNYLSLYNPIYSQNINVEFQPDKVILKYITITNNDYATTPPILFLQSSLIPNQNLISIPNSQHYSESVDIPFKIHGPINSYYDFSLRTLLNKSIPNASSITIFFSLTLIFVQYKKSN